MLARVLGSQLFPRPGGAASEGGVGVAGGASVGAGVGGGLADGEQQQQQQQQQPLPSLLSSLPAVRLVEGGPQFYDPNPDPDPDRNTNAP